jgi:hypothetical protein
MLLAYYLAAFSLFSGVSAVHVLLASFVRDRQAG